MKRSQLFVKTRKEAPAGEVSKNAQLLIKAGFVHKVMAGAYVYTPLGIRVLEKIKQIVREEMDAIGGQELIMTALQKPSTWDNTGRWDDDVVDVWFKTKLKDGSDMGLAWSHEEAIIEMIKEHITSYKDLPQNVYQFQTKFRNELRAKSGIMRGREFVMKDMYSCSIDADQHEKFYQACIDAYMKVYTRLGIGDDTYVTFASGGAFTQFSHEFQTVCTAGEDWVFHVPDTNEYYNYEIAPARAPAVAADADEKPLQDVEGEGIIGVEELSTFLELPIEQTTKTMLYVDEKDRVIAAAVRGGYTINEDKLKVVSGAQSLKLADEATIKKVTGAEVGYAGLLNLPEDVTVYMDDSMEGRTNFEMGANKTDHHTINVNFGRDLALPQQFYDIKNAERGDVHPETGKVYEVIKTAEVGNIFNFGTQKSEETDFYFTNKEGKKQYVHLGSYGIGITRVMGVIAEKMSDDKGLVWPAAIAPAQVYLVRIGDDAAVVTAADDLYQQLQDKGVETIYDDRADRVGAMLADADLTGIPTRVVVGKKSLDQGGVEVKNRTEDTARIVSIADFVSSLT